LLVWFVVPQVAKCGINSTCLLLSYRSLWLVKRQNGRKSALLSFLKFKRMHYKISQQWNGGRSINGFAEDHSIWNVQNVTSSLQILRC
jgi:hypothetical protein